jgi:transposase
VGVSLGFTDQTRIHAEVHKETIRKLKTATQQKRPTTVIKRLCCFITITEFTKLAKMENPPYSPDLAQSDYYIFPKLKKHLRGRRFSSDEYLKEAVQKCFDDLSKEFFFEGIALLE